jgi:hypothetical protein
VVRLARELHGCSQVGEHGKHAAVRVGACVEVQLEKDLLDVRLDGPFGHEEDHGHRKDLPHHSAVDPPKSRPADVA